MVPGMQPDYLTETDSFIYYPSRAQLFMSNKALQDIEIKYEKVYEVCNIMGFSNIQDQILAFGIFHLKLQLLTTKELYNIIKQYKSLNQSPTNTGWTRFLTRIKKGTMVSKITYQDLNDAVDFSDLVEIPPYDWDDIIEDIVLKSRKHFTQTY